MIVVVTFIKNYVCEVFNVVEGNVFRDFKNYVGEFPFVEVSGGFVNSASNSCSDVEGWRVFHPRLWRCGMRASYLGCLCVFAASG